MRARADFLSAPCPNCGANVLTQQTSCPACGAPLYSENLSPEAKQEAMRELVETSNERLVSSGTSAAESAFGIGCSLGGMASLLLLLIVFAFGWRDWTLLAIVALVAILTATGFSAWLANRAKSATIRTTYDREVGPQIERYARENRLTGLEFSALADQIIAEDAPLRSYLTFPSEEEQGQTPPEE
ncbi:MAG TPA: hypothetical protein VGA03_07855 [Anaerolineales bacterium]